MRHTILFVLCLSTVFHATAYMWLVCMLRHRLFENTAIKGKREAILSILFSICISLFHVQTNCSDYMRCMDKYAMGDMLFFCDASFNDHNIKNVEFSISRWKMETQKLHEKTSRFLFVTKFKDFLIKTKIYLKKKM